MKAYPKYVNSGVEWIGDIPVHWSNTRIKSVVESVVNGVWGDEPQGDENDIVCVRVADFDMQRLGVGIEKLTTRNIPESQQTGRLLYKDDLLVEKSGGGDIQPVGRVIRFDLDEKAVSSNFIGRITADKSKVLPVFLLYYMSNLYSKAINTRSIKQTTGIQNLDTYSYFSERISLPPLPEQQAIADFLDCKTAQIDTLIEKKRGQIDLLHEQRTALINHAVTKGLNPDAPMKDSGVEWLGQIPSRWEVKRLRRYEVLVQTGPFGSQLHSSDYVPNGYPVVNPANMVNGIIIPDENKQVSFEKRQELSQHILQKGDIVFARRGELGRAVLVNEKEEGWLCGTGSILIRFFEARLRSDYLSYYLQLPSLRDHFLSESVGSTMDNLNSQILLAMPLLEPSSNEQVEIVEYVNSIQEKTQQAILKVSKQIEFLQEYRTALISEAVTGKIDVREWKTVHE